MAYRRTGTGSSNITRNSSRTKELTKDFGGLDADEVQLLNGLIALGYDPNLVRSFSDQDPNRRFLGDAITRALRNGVSADDIRKALAYNKVAVEVQDPTLRAQELARALGLDMNRITAEAVRLAGQQGVRLPNADHYIQAVGNAAGLPPEAVNNFTRYARFEHADYVGKGVDRGAPAPGGGDREGRAGLTQAGIGAPPAAPGGIPPGGPGAPAGKTPAGKTPAAGTTPAAATSAGAGDPGLPANASDAKVEEWFRKNYGGTHSWLIGIPDFKEMMREIATGSGWTLQQVISTVAGKPWWQQNGENVANYLQKKTSDPVGFAQALGTKTQVVRNKMAAFGITLPEERIAQLGDEAYKWNWSDEQINKAVADEFDYQEGATSAFIDKLKTDAKNYMVPIDEATIDMWGDRLIMGGEAEGANWLHFLKEQAKGFFPAFGDRLDKGENMMQIAKPYATVASRWLEIDEGSIDWMEPKWMTALSTTDPKTGQQLAMSPADFTRKIKTDPVYRYDYTENAKQSAVGMATGLLQKFGKMA